MAQPVGAPQSEIPELLASVDLNRKLNVTRRRVDGEHCGDYRWTGHPGCQATNDKEQLEPTLRRVVPAVGPVKAALADSGFCSEAAVRTIEQDEHGQPTGITVLAAVGRIRHGRTVADLEPRADPPAPPPEAYFTDRMAHRTITSGMGAVAQIAPQLNGARRGASDLAT